MFRRRSGRRPAMLLLPFVLAAPLFPLPTLPLLPGPPGPARAFPGNEILFEGHGWGHGRGMGQWGSLGYAVDSGWNYGQILNHFYSNTSSTNIGNPTITVRLIKMDGQATTVVGPGLLTVDGIGGAYAAIQAVQVAANTFDVFAGSSCGAPATTKLGTLGGPVRIRSAAGGDANLVRVCEPDGTQRSYRGNILATRDSEGPQRTVNEVAMEDYLRGVVPRESPASWGNRTNGIEALKAQSVAARSYAWAEGRYSYAKTCDTTACQVYLGYAQNGDGLEHANTNAAIGATAGEVRANGSGTARTEFSSSTGGHTTGASFPNVPDDGDDIAENPHHRWEAKVPVSTIQNRYPSIGTLLSVDVTKRNGKGDWGGRVEEVTLRGSSGTQKVSGSEFRSVAGLKSDWFRVKNNPSGGVKGYYVADGQGGIFTFGDAPFRGSIPWLRQRGQKIGRANVVGVAVTPSGNGYYAFDSAGGVFTFGDAPFRGSIPYLRNLGQKIGRANVVDMSVTPTGLGYYALDDNGGVFTFGDARFRGSIPYLRNLGQKIGRANVMSIEPTTSGDGYWLLDDAGGVFTFGDARFRGSIPYLRNLGHRIGRATVVDMATTPSGSGYWMLDDNGGVFAFGDAGFHGSLPGIGVKGRAVAMQATVTGNGYLILTDTGNVYSFGDAPVFGNVRDTNAGFPAIASDLRVIPE